MFWCIEAIYNVFVPLLARKVKRCTKQVYMKYDSFWNHFDMISLQQALRSLSIIYDVTQWMALQVIRAQLTAKLNCDIQHKYSSPTEQKKHSHAVVHEAQWSMNVCWTQGIFKEGQNIFWYNFQKEIYVQNTYKSIIIQQIFRCFTVFTW